MTWKDETAGRWYDALMRLPVIGATAYFLWREVGALRDLVGAHPYFGGDWGFLATLAARMSVLMFLTLLAVLFAVRRRPVLKYDAWRPKAIALAGLSFHYLVLLLPRAPADPVWDALSAVLILVGSTFSILAVADLGRSLSIMPEARGLVTHGLYRRVRHPLYLAEEAAILGILVQFRSWEALAIVAVHFYFQLRRMHWEEGILGQAFPQYAEYRARSWRLLPGVY